MLKKIRNEKTQSFGFILNEKSNILQGYDSNSELFQHKREYWNNLPQPGHLFIKLD